MTNLKTGAIILALERESYYQKHWHNDEYDPCNSLLWHAAKRLRAMKIILDAAGIVLDEDKE